LGISRTRQNDEETSYSKLAVPSDDDPNDEGGNHDGNKQGDKRQSIRCGTDRHRQSSIWSPQRVKRVSCTNCDSDFLSN